MDITLKFMLRPVARCKEGCSMKSWVRRKTAFLKLKNYSIN